MPDTSHSSSGQHDLAVLLKTMSPTLQDGEYVFCSVPEAEFGHLSILPLGMFRYHDHLLVPSHLAEAALDCLTALSGQ